MMKKLVILTNILFFSVQLYALIDFEIIIPTYNNQEWCIQNIESVVNQTYPHWHATIIVDCASDITAALIKNYITDNDLDDKITLILNEKRRGALANIYFAAQKCQPHKVICLLDGDDWFADDQVLEYYNKIYETYDIWLTYGQFVSWPSGSKGWCVPYEIETIEQNNFRSVRDMPSHCRTFYAWLFRKIDLYDLLYENKFFTMTWDQAIMFPLIEMAGERHLHVSRVTYVYNESNPLNDHKIDEELQKFLAEYIRKKERYSRLKYSYKPNKDKIKIKRRP